MPQLPGTVWINGFPFVLLETDKFTLRYVNKGKIDSFVNVDKIHDKLREKYKGSKRSVDVRYSIENLAKLGLMMLMCVLIML